MNMKNYIFSTAKSDKILSHKIVINAVRLKEESIREKKLKIINQQKVKFDVFCFFSFV